MPENHFDHQLSEQESNGSSLVSDPITAHIDFPHNKCHNFQNITATFQTVKTLNVRLYFFFLAASSFIYFIYLFLTSLKSGKGHNLRILVFAGGVFRTFLLRWKTRKKLFSYSKRRKSFKTEKEVEDVNCEAELHMTHTWICGPKLILSHHVDAEVQR